eukprot:COSAG05_NODE_5250_length_1225_cov_4.557726_2_plen_298_part_01
MATPELLLSLDNETQIRLLSCTLNRGLLTNDQKEEILLVTKKTLQTFTIQTNVKEYVRNHPDFLLEGQFPPIDTKKFQDGNISTGSQKSYANSLMMVFNCVNGKGSDMWVISDNLQEDFLSGNWLHDAPSVDSALKKRNSRGTSRRLWYDACRQLCRVFEITDSKNPCNWPAITKQYETLINYIDYGKDEREAEPGTHDCQPSSEKYKSMSEQECGEHVQSIREYSAKILKFVQPLLESLIGKTEKQLATGLSKMHIFEHAVDGHNKKKLGTWAQDCMLMLWKHGQCDDADLRPMRCG